MRHELLHHAADQIDRNREAQAFRRRLVRRGAEHGRVDADELAFRVHQRAARVAGVDSGVGLDEVLERRDAQLAAALGAHNAHCDGLAEPQRVADRQHDLADFEVV